ncbi:MAG: sigma-54-dependent Fis family transcriptional regulator [Deltaproteobacteria bacterium]|nr:sigma-54-dependent Fis family transcriptional regulator [Deltaproteobacteria bacterium]
MTLAAEIEPDAEALWAAVSQVMLGLRDGADLDTALDAVVEAVGADRAALLVFEPHAEIVMRARGPQGALEDHEWEEISRSLVREARERGEAVLWDAFDAIGTEGSLADLGVLAAAATPLTEKGGALTGVLYVDVREPGKSLGEAHLSFLRVAASVLSGALTSARRLERATAAKGSGDAERRPAHLSLFDLVASPSMQGAADAVRTALGTDLNVLITGESGCGKTELALAMARASGDGPVVRATLGMSDDLNTLTSELFGHERGAFSGAASRRVGLVERAAGGTLILDEVLNLPRGAQQLLLDFTQFGHYRPLGYDGAEPRQARVRLLCATQGDLGAAVDEGHFRRDLYYRLAGVTIHMPALRERRDDLSALAESLMRRRDPGRPWHLSMELRRALTNGSRSWDGNLRELEAVFEGARHRAALRSPEGSEIILADLSPDFVKASPRATLEDEQTQTLEESIETEWSQLAEARERLSARERRLLERALREEAGVVSRVARRLQLPRTTLLHRMTTLGVRDDGSQAPE